MSQDARYALIYVFLIVALVCNVCISLMTQSRSIGLITVAIATSLLIAGHLLKGITNHG